MGRAGFDAAAVSLDQVITGYTDQIEINPVEFNGKPVEASPATICVLAGYQLAIEADYKTISDKTAYTQINASGWGQVTAVSGFDFRPSVVDDWKGMRVLSRVVCRKKLAL